jgi:hypothetical protein
MHAVHWIKVSRNSGIFNSWGYLLLHQRLMFVDLFSIAKIVELTFVLFDSKSREGREK